MNDPRSRFSFFLRLLILCVVAALCFGACESGGGTDSNTNWLRSCRTGVDCNGLSCVCGVCTAPCADDSACGAFKGATCHPVATGSFECGGVTGSTCALPCGSSSACGRADLSCVAGLCIPAAAEEPDASLGQGGGSNLPREAGSDGPFGSNGGTIGRGGSSSGGRGASGNDEAGLLAGGGATSGTGGAAGPATFCNNDGICQVGKEQTGTCADCTPGFTIIGAPPVGQPGVTKTIGQGGADVLFAADAQRFYFSKVGLYAFDLDALRAVAVAPSLDNLVTMAITSTDVVFTSSGAVAYELGRVPKTGGTVQDLGVTAQAPVLADDAGLVFAQGSGMVKTTLATLPAVTPLANLDPAGFAWGLTNADVIEVVRSGNAIELLRVNRATGLTEMPSLAPRACTTSTCTTAIATSGTHAVMNYSGDLLLWDDGADGPTTLDQVMGPVATDGVSAYYWKGDSIWKHSLALDGGAPSTFANETPLAIWVTDTYVLWTVSTGATIELHARVK